MWLFMLFWRIADLDARLDNAWFWYVVRQKGFSITTTELENRNYIWWLTQSCNISENKLRAALHLIHMIHTYPRIWWNWKWLRVLGMNKTYTQTYTKFGQTHTYSANERNDGSPSVGTFIKIWMMRVMCVWRSGTALMNAQNRDSLINLIESPA